jgi:hypothetical protein
MHFLKVGILLAWMISPVALAKEDSGAATLAKEDSGAATLAKKGSGTAALVKEDSGTAALAKEDSGAVILIHFSLLDYGISSQKTTLDGSSTNQKISNIVTVDMEKAWLSLEHNKTLIYFYPWANTKQISIGRLLSDSFEAGLDLGINSNKQDNPKSESSALTFGVYGYYYPTIFDLDTELGIFLDHTSELQINVDAETQKETKSKKNSLLASVLINAIIPLAKNLNYVFGLSYEMTSAKETESVTKTSSSVLKFNLASLRLQLN